MIVALFLLGPESFLRTLPFLDPRFHFIRYRLHETGWVTQRVNVCVPFHALIKPEWSEDRYAKGDGLAHTLGPVGGSRRRRHNSQYFAMKNA
mmetsp:Transcript_70556/g.138712  ORF Transcript_70556/g.138712 Transcript_70556/m.138712 type:complete len:92 (+) Transcript_70556:189-464(+)